MKKLHTQKTIHSSLAKAQASISQEEYNEALKQNLISADEIRKIVAAKNLNEMKEKRENKASSKAQKSNSRKRSR